MLRRRAEAGNDPVAEFWSWWPGARPRVERAIESGEWGTLIDEFSMRVHAIDPGLEWELGRGQVARHSLCVTPAGKGELRAVTERWRVAGPRPDATWEYAAARPADLEALDRTLRFDETELNLVELRLGVTVDDEREQVDVVVHHPRFASMTDEAKTTVSFLVLDWLMGEDGVERWIGSVSTSDEDRPASVPADALTEIIGALQGRHPEPSWSLLKATGPDGRPILALARRPLKRVEHPLFDLHGGIELPFVEQTPEGVPLPPALDRLRAFEDHLLALGVDDLLVAAHETYAGTRTLHVYCDSHGAARSTVDDFLGKQRWPGLRVTWSLDPGWEAIQPYQ